MIIEVEKLKERLNEITRPRDIHGNKVIYLQDVFNQMDIMSGYRSLLVIPPEVALFIKNSRNQLDIYKILKNSREGVIDYVYPNTYEWINDNEDEFLMAWILNKWNEQEDLYVVSDYDLDGYGYILMKDERNEIIFKSDGYAPEEMRKKTQLTKKEIMNFNGGKYWPFAIPVEEYDYE